MTTAPLTPAATEGVNAHIRRLREITAQFTAELGEMHKLEAALQAAIDRLDRGASLVTMEAKHVTALIQHERPAPPPPKVATVATVATIVDKVSADLDRMIAAPSAMKAPGP